MSLFDLFFEEIPEDEEEETTPAPAPKSHKSKRLEEPVSEEDQLPVKEISEEEKKYIELGRAQQEFKTKYRTRVVSHGLVSVGVTALIFVVFLVVMLSIISRIYRVEGNGMAPTIAENEYILVNKLAYKIRLPERGDVVCANGRIYRIIALPGEKVDIYAGHVYIDGKIANEIYLNNNASTYDYNGTAPTGELNGYFVLCDNRMCFDDSRSGELLQLSNIEGKVVAY